MYSCLVGIWDVSLSIFRLCEPIEFIPRHKGLGLGAEKRMTSEKNKRKKKLGETEPNDKVRKLEVDWLTEGLISWVILL